MAKREQIPESVTPLQACGLVCAALKTAYPDLVEDENSIPNWCVAILDAALANHDSQARGEGARK